MDKTCYFPNGEVSGDIPCNAAAPSSHCCGVNAVCISNGYCFSQSARLAVSRGSCTDQSWGNSSGCPSFCKDVNTDSGSPVYLARKYGPGQDNDFCCDGPPTASQQCQTPTLGSSEPFNLPSGYIIVDRNTGQTISDLANAEAANDSSPSPMPQPAPETSQGGSDSEAIGIGLGVSLGVLLLTFVALFVWQFLRGRGMAKRIQELEKEPLVVGSKLGHDSISNMRSSHSHSSARSQQSRSHSPRQLDTQQALPVTGQRDDLPRSPFLVDNTKPRMELDPAFEYVEMHHTDRMEMPS